MKASWKKLLCMVLLFALCASLCCFRAAAEGAGITALRVSEAAAEDETSVGAVNWFYSAKDGSYYLFLPASYDKAALRVWFTADADVLCGENQLVSGEVTDAFAGGTAVLTCGAKQYTVHVLDGAQTGAVYINTESGSLDAVDADKEYREPGTIRVLDENGAVLYDGALDYIKGRGNSTWSAAKKPYNIKLNKKADLFGMGKAKKWCLLANASDASLLRNQLSYAFARSLGVDVTSDVVPVGLYVNGSYLGAYTLTEKVEIGENRIDITDLEKLTEAVNEKPLDAYALGGDQHSRQKGSYQYVKVPNNPEDISGGYLLELEKVYRYFEEDAGFVSGRGQAIVLKSPESASQAEVEFIRDYYQQFEDALYSSTGYNAEGKHYTDYIDVDSIARMYVAEEFAQNFDGCSSSFYLYKDVDGKLAAGPAWDFDLTFSNNSRLNTLINRTTPIGNPQSLYIQHCFIDNFDESHKAFLAQLFTHNDFQQLVQQIWHEMMPQAYPELLANIDAFSSAVSAQAVMNAIRWNAYGTTAADAILAAYRGRVDAVRAFAQTRYAFLSEAYADDTCFVKYDVGEDGAALVFDPTIYHTGEQATVKAEPVSKGQEKHFCGWTTAPDGAGQRFEAGDSIRVDQNVVLYASWEAHHLQRMADGTDTCAVCGVTCLNGALISDGWYADSYFKNSTRVVGFQKLAAQDGSGTFLYQFGDDGKLIGKYTGLLDGMYYEDGVLAKGRGVILLDGSYYYIGQQGQVFTGKSLYLKDSMTNGLLPAGTYEFRPDGTILLKEGIIDGYYYEQGTVVKGKGVILLDGSYYYIGQRGQVFTGKSLYLNAVMTNGLLSAGTYEFRPDGTILLKEGIIDGYYYEQGTVVKGKGVILLDGSYYYIGQKGQVYKNGTLFLSASVTNGLLPAGKYTFDATGKIVF